MSPLVVYGGPPSQPTRAVVWACSIHALPLEVRAGAAMRGDEFRRMNPKSQMPTMQDGEFVLYEMPAILAYLSDKHRWRDAYPTDLETRARVNQYLHFHHSSTRLATFLLMGPHVTSAFGGPPRDSLDPLMVDTIFATMETDDKWAAGRRAFDRILPLIERGYFFDGAPFLCGTASPTLADIACYEELAQLRWAGLHDFAEHPRILAWLEEMAKLPAHDAIHAYNTALGDIANEPNTMERWSAATTEGLEAWRSLGVVVAAENGEGVAWGGRAG